MQVDFPEQLSSGKWRGGFGQGSAQNRAGPFRACGLTVEKESEFMSTKKTASSTRAKARNSAKPDRNSKGGTTAKARASSKPSTSLKSGTGSEWHTNPVAKSGSSPKPGKMEKAIRKSVKDISATIESMAPPGSPERIAAGVAAVTGGALLAGATLGAGPAALAGAAGYLAYKGLTAPDTKESGASSGSRKRSTTSKRKT